MTRSVLQGKRVSDGVRRSDYKCILIYLQCEESRSRHDIHPTTDSDITNFFSEYPMFPKYSTDIELIKYLDVSVQIVESWVYTQGFFASCFFKIPEGINFVIFCTEAKPSKNENRKDFIFPYIDMLSNFVGQEIVTELLPK